LGEQVVSLARQAKKELVLAAPFIKVDALNRVLEAVSEAVEVRCVTRWRLDEIAAGVSDLEVWDVLKCRPKSALLLRHDLHAKYYRADDTCLVGSANLTGTALAWAQRCNLELLVPMPAAAVEIGGFEAFMLEAARPVTQELYDHINVQLDALPPTCPPPASAHDVALATPTMSFSDWWPRSRNPEVLHSAYLGLWDELALPQRESAAHDLGVLDLSSHLPEALFRATVGNLLLQHPSISLVDQFVAQSRRFGEVADFVRTLRHIESSEQAQREWQTLMRWLLHFLPTRYLSHTPRHSEIFVRRSSL
jgi:hypothetical protein